MIGDPVAAGAELTLDVIRPFQLERSNVRGRAARFGPLLDEIVSRHAYPELVEQLVAHAVLSTVLLSSLLKYDGIFTLQARGDGPVSLLVADVTSGGAVRAYARYDSERLAADGGGALALLGQGYLSFTVDQQNSEDRYQGIVALTGEHFDQALGHYFEQSEQLATTVRTAARKYSGGWRAGGILVQKLPEDDAGRVQKPEAEDEEDWRRASILLGSVADVELLDRTLDLDTLLFRLFHEERVRVFDAHRVHRGCRCSAERVETVLKSLDRDELREMEVEGAIVVTCEFCSEPYRYDETALRRLFG